MWSLSSFEVLGKMEISVDCSHTDVVLAISTDSALAAIAVSNLNRLFICDTR